MLLGRSYLAVVEASLVHLSNRSLHLSEGKPRRQVSSCRDRPQRTSWVATGWSELWRTRALHFVKRNGDWVNETFGTFVGGYAIVS